MGIYAADPDYGDKGQQSVFDIRVSFRGDCWEAEYYHVFNGAERGIAKSAATPEAAVAVLMGRLAKHGWIPQHGD